MLDISETFSSVTHRRERRGSLSSQQLVGTKVRVCNLDLEEMSV